MKKYFSALLIILLSSFTTAPRIVWLDELDLSNVDQSADALKETVLPSSFMRNTLAACVPTPRSNFSPAIESGVFHID